MSGIKHNDLVQVVRWPCCRGALGAIFLADAVIRTEAGIKCDNCGHRYLGPRVLVSNGCGGVVPIGWVKRYRTPDELGLAVRATTAPQS